jgi:hypothetical protein
VEKIWRSIGIKIVCLGIMLGPAVSMAADFELFWDPNCEKDAALDGYYIYYNENASVVGNLNEATEIYVSVTNNGFDRAKPSYQISNLKNNVRYCFAVTAWYGDEESAPSNEICGTKSVEPEPAEPNPEPAEPNPEPAEPDPEPAEPDPEPAEPDPEPAEPNPEPDTNPVPDDEDQAIIIDDDDIGSSSDGAWVVSGGADPYGTRSLYSREVGATYSYEALLTGAYEVALRWTYYKTRCAEVTVEIYDGDNFLDTVLVDQTQNGGQFNVLGTYDFRESATVLVVSETDNCSTCADAASFRSITSDPETEDDSGQEPSQQPHAGNNPVPDTGNDLSPNNLSEHGSGGGCFINQLK